MFLRYRPESADHSCHYSCDCNCHSAMCATDAATIRGGSASVQCLAAIALCSPPVIQTVSKTRRGTSYSLSILYVRFW